MELQHCLSADIIEMPLVLPVSEACVQTCQFNCPMAEMTEHLHVRHGILSFFVIRNYVCCACAKNSVCVFEKQCRLVCKVKKVCHAMQNIHFSRSYTQILYYLFRISACSHSSQGGWLCALCIKLVEHGHVRMHHMEELLAVGAG